MNLNEAVAGALPEMRRQAESAMTLTVTASSSAGRGEVKPGDLRATIQRVDHGSSIAKIQSAGRQPQGRTVDVGGSQRVVMEGGLHLPLDAYLDGEHRLLIRPGWQFEVTAVSPIDDPALLGQRYQVVEVLKKSRLTARRLDVVEV